VGTEQAWRYPTGPKGNTESCTIWGGGKGLPRRDEPLEGPNGRFPANLTHDGSDEVVGMFPHAARFFYCPKASKADRDEGCEDLEVSFKQRQWAQSEGRVDAGKQESTFPSHNNHPTVKPTPLLQYLCRLITPPNGLVLDPFAGSGSTGKACKKEGFRFIGIEKEAEYCEIARRRI
jgi:site-specific DNA-methyltransferase (adenine-specific)